MKTKLSGRGLNNVFLQGDAIQRQILAGWTVFYVYNFKISAPTDGFLHAEPSLAGALLSPLRYETPLIKTFVSSRFYLFWLWREHLFYVCSEDINRGETDLMKRERITSACEPL